LVLFGWLEIADTDRAVGVEAEDFIEGIDHRRGRRDDGAADDGHLALVNIAAPDGEAAVDDRRDAQDETEHHDYGETVADAGLQVGGIEAGALGKGGEGIEREQCRNGEERAETVQESDAFFHSVVCACFGLLFSLAAHAAFHAHWSSTFRKRFCVIITQNENIFLAGLRHEYDAI